MIAVLTGDIVNSRKGETKNWLTALKNVLSHYGAEPKDWEIYRGDSFQLSVKPENAFIAAIHIKAEIKKTTSLDVRLGIGLGEETHKADKITESNGSAYQLSGEGFDLLKKQTLAFKLQNKELTQELNLMLALLLLTADRWSNTVAEVIKTVIEHPEKNQQEIAQILNKSQSNVSEALKRGGFEEIMNMNKFYQAKISVL
ncbi:transcriptional regulator [bacterium]|jgi:hypothetical protein|nr:transcriptional regulator [Balneola sp.]MBR9918061.1 transcriptional regulator [bacterium]